MSTFTIISGAPLEFDILRQLFMIVLPQVVKMCTGWVQEAQRASDKVGFAEKIPEVLVGMVFGELQVASHFVLHARRCCSII
jgi:hypothetical protein